MGLLNGLHGRNQAPRANTLQDGLMKNFFSLVIFVFLLSGCGNKKKSEDLNGFVSKPDNSSCQNAQIKNQFVVVWKDGSITREYSRDREGFVKQFMNPNEDQIQFAEHDYYVEELTPVGKDSGLGGPSSFSDWGLVNIEASPLWQKGILGQGIKVAVIDSGTDIHHPAFSGRISINTGEIPDNQIDDDKNGYVDDYYGYSYVSNDDDVASGSLHGTHVSGIIAAGDTGVQSNNVALGVAPEAEIIPLKFIDSSGGGYVSNAIDAIDYSVKRGAKVINASWGGGCSEGLRVKLEQLSQKDVLFVAAAGNSSKDIDVDPEFPAAYNFDRTITVGAISKFNGLAFFSNYGLNTVHLFAPGEEIYNTAPNSSYTTLDGTSMAAPFVSGAAALLWSYRPEAKAENIKQALLDSVVIQKDSQGFTEYHNITKGRLNLKTSIEILDKLLE